MSRYNKKPLEFEQIRTVPLKERGGKVRIEHLAKPYQKGAGVLGLVEALPRVLAAEGLRKLAEAIHTARQTGKPIIWGLGGHVIKCGLGPVLIDLIRRGYATGFALNGSAAIHDFELALAGHTSEDVGAVLPDGRFGMAAETGEWMNRALVEAAEKGLDAGFGEIIGAALDRVAHPAWGARSLVLAAWRASVPVTVHVAVGTDTPHMHPAASGEAIGRATYRDFKLFCRLVSEMDGGGVYLNVGSAVILPEVFLKAVSVVRNLGYRLEEFTTANLDFIQHYRPRVNVLERPHVGGKGSGIAITGHHELMVPLLAAILVELDR